MRSLDALTALRPHDVQRLDEILASFLGETHARSALLLDRTGRLLAAAGEVAQLDGTTFASLAAADFAASDQLAALLGEREFTSLYHHGERGSMYLVDVAGRAILAALFDGRTTLGMVRLRTRIALPRFAEVFNDLAAGSGPGDAEPGLGADWAAEAGEEIDRLFTD